MRKRLIEIINQFEELDFCVPPDWWIEHFANHLLDNGVTIPPVTCKNCTFYEPFDKVEDFDGRCCLMNGSEVDEDFYCKWGAKK